MPRHKLSTTRARSRLLGNLYPQNLNLETLSLKYLRQYSQNTVARPRNCFWNPWGKASWTIWTEHWQSAGQSRRRRFDMWRQLRHFL